MPPRGRKKIVDEATVVPVGAEVVDAARSANSTATPSEATEAAVVKSAKPAAAKRATAVRTPRAPRASAATAAAAAAAAADTVAASAAPTAAPSLPFGTPGGEARVPSRGAGATVAPTVPAVRQPAAPHEAFAAENAQRASAPAPLATGAGYSGGGESGAEAARGMQAATTEPGAYAQQPYQSGGGGGGEHGGAPMARPGRFEDRDARSEVRALEGRPPEIQGRGVESRGLRFRGREGRAEVRGRDARNDTRGFRPRTDNREGGEGAYASRLAPREPNHTQHRNDNVRHNENRNADNRGGERDFQRNRSDGEPMALDDKNINELRIMAGDLGIMSTPSMKKTELVMRILDAQSDTGNNITKKGILEILPDGKGFLRTEGYLPGNEDVYVSQSQIKRFNLRTGDMVTGQVRAPKEMERYYGLLRVEATNDEPPDLTRSRKEFEKLTPIFPDDKFKLETTQENITARIIDLVSPIGKGQRGLIVAPPKAGKTTLIKNIANSIMANHPEVYLIVLLIDERPEEVTDISRSVRGEVVASTFDEMPDNHVRVADMVLEKAKRMVEQKKDVVILLDSLTRLSRASNLVVAPSGRTMSGGLDPAAMHKPKRLFGAARNIEEGGSLTILATALVDTGSRMDDYIFEEFKGTGNLDLVLDRSLFDQRIFPAIDINRSGTRRDDLLLSKDDLATVFHLRRTLASLDNDKAITLLIDRLKNTKSNEDFMAVVQKSARNTSSQ